MEGTLKELTLAVLHNNEIILDQTEDITKERKESTHAIDNMRKIYEGVTRKIVDDEALTAPDCKFLVMAVDIATASLLRQQRVIEKTLEMYEALKGVYQSAGEGEGLSDLSISVTAENEESNI